MVNEHRISQLLEEAVYFENHRMWLHAIQIYQRLIHDVPEEWNYRVRLGTVYLEMGNLQAAEQVLLQALRYDKENPDVLYALGLACYQSGDLDRALFYLQQLAGKSLAKVHYSLGLVYWRRSEFGSAERHFRIALDLQSDHVDSAVALGETCLRIGKTREAVEALRRAAMLSPGDDMIELTLGQSLVADGQWDSAASVFETMLSRSPDNDDCAHALAGAWISLKRLDEAEQLLKSLLLRLPQQARTLVMLGRLALLKSNRGRAESYFSSALAIDPENEEALEQIRYFTPHGNTSA
ncbi:MAG: tetratricopeptide repeat protein [Bacteroidetes bacterium]|nr:tetratricopeptide repeat protein [Bacteroidota bacterium]